MEIIETRVSFDADFKINMDSEVSEFTMDYPITVKKKQKQAFYHDLIFLCPTFSSFHNKHDPDAL